MIESRYLTKNIQKDLEEKMVFIGGPRQAGKTTLARDLIAKGLKSAYYNWDKIDNRKNALNGLWPPETDLIILDEFHKNPKWKTWLKGEYDTHKDKYRFLFTGSARMNVYRKGGDSLQGRYHYYTLHPFSVAELNGYLPAVQPGGKLSFKEDKKNVFDALLRFGGFPEPFIKKDSRFLRRWHMEKTERFFKEDIRDLTAIKDFANLSLLSGLLPEKVSSILSINSLAEDLQVNFKTAARWLDVFEQLYYCYRIAPYQNRKTASVKKEKKLYLWDWSQIKDEGRKLENLVASHLLKFRDYLREYEGYDVELYFLRNKEGKETDFLMTSENRPWFCAEVKSSDTDIPKNMFYFKDRLNIPYNFLVTGTCENERMQKGIRVMPVAKFLTAFV